jgi:hypothetical protein
MRLRKSPDLFRFVPIKPDRSGVGFNRGGSVDIALPIASFCSDVSPSLTLDQLEEEQRGRRMALSPQPSVS